MNYYFVIILIFELLLYFSITNNFITRQSKEIVVSFDDVREMTATGLLYLVDQRTYIDINIDVKPSFFILPENGKFRR